MSGWIGLEPSDMPDGENPMYDHPFFIQGIVWAATKLFEKNHMIDDDDTQVYQSELEAAVKAAVEAERSKLQAQEFEIYKMGYKQGASDERQACVTLCDEMEASPVLTNIEKYRARFIADAIRARGEKT
jgi:hypothetical protein